MVMFGCAVQRGKAGGGGDTDVRHSVRPRHVARAAGGRLCAEPVGAACAAGGPGRAPAHPPRSLLHRLRLQHPHPWAMVRAALAWYGHPVSVACTVSHAAASTRHQDVETSVAWGTCTGKN